MPSLEPAAAPVELDEVGFVGEEDVVATGGAVEGGGFGDGRCCPWDGWLTGDTRFRWHRYGMSYPLCCVPVALGLVLGARIFSFVLT